MEKTAVIIVLYKPKQLYYEILCKRANTFVVLVDNTPNVDMVCVSGENTVYLPQKANLGIAKAQNIGISRAKELGCKYVIFFDQDSRPSIELVDRLISDFIALKSQGITVAAVGPKIINQVIGEAYKIRGKLFGGFLETGTIISSGMTTDMDTLIQVGGMDEWLFIDLVDHEWCWRARAKGYRVFMSTSVPLPHSVGKACKSFMGFPIIVSAPFRYYYSYRNALVLMMRRYVPLSWKVKSLIRRVFGLAHIALCDAYRGHRKELYRNIIKGINDAFHYGK